MTDFQFGKGYIEQHNIWPTTITKGILEFGDKSKAMQAIFDAIVDAGGDISGEESGILSLHKDTRLDSIYEQIANLIRHRLELLSVEHNKLNINIHKSWPNILINRATPIHSHKDAHISFSFYLNVPEDKAQDLVFTRTQTEPHPNDPYPFAFGHLVKSYDWYNCLTYSLNAEEGSAYVFPSHVAHFTQGKSSYTGELEKINTIDDLYNSRVCVAGDVLFTFKELHKETTGIQPHFNWRTFS